jgi:hypothetical protein
LRARERAYLARLRALVRSMLGDRCARADRNCSGRLEVDYPTYQGLDPRTRWRLYQKAIRRGEDVHLLCVFHRHGRHQQTTIRWFGE